MSVRLDCLPTGARVFAIRAGTKDRPLTPHGHLDARPLSEYVDLDTNAGLALDGQFLLVDIDRDCPESRELEAHLREQPTWSQQARRGAHRLYALPPDWVGGNVTLRDADGKQYGDAKTRGYVMAPGSEVAGHVYVCDAPREPAPVPDWLREFCASQAKTQPATPTDTGTDSVSPGSQHNFAIKLAGFLRRQGLSPQAMEAATPALKAWFADQDPNRPWIDADFRAIYKSTAAWAPEPTPGDSDGGWLPEGWQAGHTTPIVGPPERWWVEGFIPEGELTMVYGKGGTGKSTFGSWVACEVTRRGGNLAVIGVEEPFRRFLRRAVLGGAQRERIFGTDVGHGIKLPRDAQQLETVISLLGVQAVYFDSITSHMEHSPGQNVQQSTRDALGALAQIAKTTGVAVICVFHENKTGEYGGSVEMLNVARHVLHLTRRPNGPLRVRVRKTNLEEPEVALQFEADEFDVVDPLTGEPQIRVVDGTETIVRTKVLRPIEPIPLDQADADEVDLTTVSTGGAPRGDRLKGELADLMRDAPSLTQKELADHLHVSERTIKRYAPEIRETLRDLSTKEVVS